MPRCPTLVLAVVLALGAAGCHRSPTKSADKQAVQSVTTALVGRHDISGAMTASGRLVPRQDIAVAADLNGFRVAKVLVDEGDTVRRGQVLAVLDDSLLRSQIDQVRAALAQQQLAADQAAAEAARVNGLENQGVLSREAIETRRYTARSSRAAVAATRAQLSDLLTRENHLQIRAPTDGFVLERTVRPGDTSSTGNAMFRLARDGLIELYAEIPEGDVDRLSVGAPADVTLASGRKLAGTVRLIGKRVDTDTGLAIARISLPRDAELRQGGFAQARFTGTFSVLAVPEAAVHFDADGASVKVIGSDGRVHRQAVRTGRRGQGLVELLQGPPDGSKVAVKGSAFVLDGDEIRILGTGGR